MNGQRVSGQQWAECALADSIIAKQPHLVVRLPDEVHVISIVQIRQLANGCEYNGDKSAMIQVLATAVKGLIDE